MKAVSVVIPTYRRPRTLAQCLDALALQDLPSDKFEIVVADDGPDEQTHRQVRSFAATAAMTVRYLPVEKVHGPAAARNLGWRNATADIIAFTDDDCQPESDWLSSGVAAFRNHPDAMAIAGRVIVPLPPRPTDYERDAAGLEATEFVTANCFCRRTALSAVGGFDERFRLAWREDSDLFFAIVKAGATVIHDDSVRVVHPVRPAPWGVSLRQQTKCLYDALLYQKHPELFRSRIIGAPWRYYAIIASALGVAGSLAGGLNWAALAFAAAWLVLTGSFIIRRLQDTSRSPAHVAEMVVTSILIPPISVFWRLYGAVKFRVWFL